MKILSPPGTRWLVLVAALVIVFSTLAIAQQPGGQRTRLKFVGVDLNLTSSKQTSGSKAADGELAEYLEPRAQVNFDEEEVQDYEVMIRKLVDWKTEDGRYLARVTPFVYVAASILGADFELLATYKNSSGKSTYNSYLVINRKAFPAPKDNLNFKPTLEQIVDVLGKKPARFIYHDKFSTSSYFLPAVFFRNNDLYSMPDATSKGLKLINTEDINKDLARGQARLSSTALIKRVANQEVAADQEIIVAAVWDATISNATKEEQDKVYFVKLPNELPNDLLVCSNDVDPVTKQRLRDAIRNMPESQSGQKEIKQWVEINDAREARQALKQLQHLAEQHATAATIRVEKFESAQMDDQLLEFIKRAIQHSNTEFVPWEKDYHTKEDVLWEVKSIHDKAIHLKSTIKYTNLEPQEFEISYTDGEDLMKRIGNIIQSRMHRIRYVWPYEDHFPTVIRDVDFPVLPNSVFKVAKITWNDPKHNDFFTSEWEQFDATVSKANRFGFQLTGGKFPPKFDPLSNTSYRVVLVRDIKEGRVFTALTYAFVGLVILAALGAVFDMRRRAKLADLPIVNMEDFKQRCRELADKSRSFWREHKLRDADVMWCSRKSLEELIADLKANASFNAVQTRSRRMAAHIPILNKYLGLSVGAEFDVVTVIDPSKFSDTQRLADTIEYLMNQNAFSSFIGEKLEWDALDQMTTDIFRPFRIEEASLNGNGNGNGNSKPAEARRAPRRKTGRTSANSRKRTSLVANNHSDSLIRSEHPMILSAVEKHFNEVLEQSKERVCFFGKQWQVKKNRTVIHLACSAQLHSPLQLNGTKSTVSKLTLHAEIPRSPKTDEFAKSKELSAWLFGKVTDVGRNGSARTLLLTFQPTALVRTDDPE